MNYCSVINDVIGAAGCPQISPYLLGEERAKPCSSLLRLELGSRRESSIYLIISQHAEGVVMISSGCNSLPNKHCLMTSFDSLFFLKKKLR